MGRTFLAVLLLLLVACELPASTDATGFSVRFHPDGPLFIGDQVSIEILTPASFDPTDHEVQVIFDKQILGTSSFAAYGFSERIQATLWWIWDTNTLDPGTYTLTFTILPDGPSWQEKIRMISQAEMPPPEPEADWAMATSECCDVYYITGTTAEGDLSQLLELIDEQAVNVSQRMGTEFIQDISITFIPRILGHGGFTSDDSIYISYLDNPYSGSTPGHILHHELVHIVDKRLGGDLHPALLNEGLAVYQSDGHFKPEPILPRAAALIDLGWYIPLEGLANDFYTQQHEIGYLEAGALVAFMAKTYGWESFNAFYRDIHTDPSDSPANAIEVALQRHFGISLAKLEADFLAYLSTQTVNNQVREDLRLSILFYDTVRRYQQQLDPSAYFLSAWLPDGTRMREHGIVADYLRHPSAPSNKYIEAQLVRADNYLREGQYANAERILGSINRNLEILSFLVFQ